jgi:hypothetical protein
MGGYDAGTPVADAAKVIVQRNPVPARNGEGNELRGIVLSAEGNHEPTFIEKPD